MPSSLIDVICQHAPTPTSTIPPTSSDQHELLAALGKVPDPRDPRGIRYPLASILAVAVCAVLAGATTFTAITDWAADLDPAAWIRLGFTNRIPVPSTVWRLLVRIDAETLAAVLADWLRSRLPACAPTGRCGMTVIAVDGKVLRGARLPDGRQVHLLSAYDTTTGLVLAQVQIAAKSNEIPAFRPLLQQVAARLGSLDNVVVVADALHTQATHAADVAALGGHLYVTVKANQPTLFTQLKHLPWAGTGISRRPLPRHRARPSGNPNRQGADCPHPRGPGVPAGRAGRAHHSNPDRGRQTHAGNGVPGGVPTRRPGPAR